MPRTRDDAIHEARDLLKALAQDCVDCDQIEPAQSLLAAVQFCTSAADQLAQAGEGETPYPPVGPMSAARRQNISNEARRLMGLNAPEEGQTAGSNAHVDPQKT